MHISIDGKIISVQSGQTVLEAALAQQIFIPHLCRNQQACRLCLVQIGEQIIPACQQKVSEGLIVQTRTPQVEQKVKLAWSLLLAKHQMRCGSCPRQKDCQLKKIAQLYNLPLPPKTFSNLQPDLTPVEFNSGLAWYPSQCLLCGQCLKVCPALGLAGKGTKRRIALQGSPDCRLCQKCLVICPGGALDLISKPTEN